MSATRAEQITAGLIWRVQCRYVGGLRCVESGVCAVFLMMWGVLCGVFEGEGKSWPVLWVRRCMRRVARARSRPRPCNHARRIQRACCAITRRTSRHTTATAA